ncbi:MAG: cysteine--tRNA ligase [Candidatus Levybacteria bacterium RIFCSPLOWO2_01_FULL_38_13]|nr:MAG: cysteine--tRNA ligase [Candidatus Levybacteria bacterium RIFCSPHIGHO2_01_FULL_41_15]OGH35313.1 MAG: cysteine--tRNA ligase [Candidatus Levybacteria bacterium RIFCSPLOWO2_01_FULL_38_13]
MLRIFNSQSRKKEKFKPIKDKEVSIYVCGMTPYDIAHLGHAFTYVFFDVLVRYLAFSGYKVNYTQNVTDVDDDILRTAKIENKNWKKLGDFWTKKFTQDMEYLNVLPPTHFVKATGSMKRIKKIIQKLLDKNYAYSSGGNIYFDIAAFKNYGKLSRYSRHQMIALSRERGGDPSDPNKKNPLDFVLWQKSKKNEPAWIAPFGTGRPGWHIECSAMVNQFLGDRVDIHGGGKDLIFPHHESEIAQSESYTDKTPFVKYWMHTAMILCNGEKMSKSLGNLIMINELRKYYSGDDIRWYLLSNYYRKPFEYDEYDLKESKKKLLLVKEALEDKKGTIGNFKSDMKTFEALMDDDLSTPETLKFVLELAKKVKKTAGKNKIAFQETLGSVTSTLGFRF